MVTIANNTRVVPDASKRVLSDLLIEAIRIARARTEALQASVALNAEKNAENKRLQEQNTHLRAQVRAMMSGRTLQEELRKLGRVEIEPDYEAVEAKMVTCDHVTDQEVMHTHNLPSRVTDRDGNCAA